MKTPPVLAGINMKKLHNDIDRELDTPPVKQKCKHCEMDIAIRNPSGFCDHLYYPENCYVCFRAVKQTQEWENKCMEDITPIKYKIQNIFANITEYGKLDFSKSEYRAMEDLEKLLASQKQEMVEKIREKIKSFWEQIYKEQERTAIRERSFISFAPPTGMDLDKYL